MNYLKCLIFLKQALNGPMNDLKEKELVHFKPNENDKRNQTALSDRTRKHVRMNV